MCGCVGMFVFYFLFYFFDSFSYFILSSFSILFHFIIYYYFTSLGCHAADRAASAPPSQPTFDPHRAPSWARQ